MHPDKARIFTKMPEGKNLLYDRAIQGFEGTDETINTSRGAPCSLLSNSLHLTKWLLAANYPQAEAYAPLAHTGRFFWPDAGYHPGGLCGYPLFQSISDQIPG